MGISDGHDFLSWKILCHVISDIVFDFKLVPRSFMGDQAITSFNSGTYVRSIDKKVKLVFI